MSQAIDDGGPAVPRPASTDEHERRCNHFDAQSGITVRDYFAAHAPPSPARIYGDCENNLDELVQWNYEYADAMIRQRNLP